MLKFYMLLATLIGVIAGIVLFIVRLTPSPEGVRGASRFRRELILTAMIVAALLAYGLEGFTKDLSNEPPAAATGASPGTMDVAACKQSKEWQDLRVFWSLITGNPAVLSGDERAGRFSFFHIPEWKYSLLKVALKHRIDQLDRLIQQGMMTTGTKKAVENLFNDITYHFYRSNCGATCYISVGLGQKKESVASLSQQAEKLREQYRKGELQGEVLKAVEADLGEKLRALEVLSDFTPVEVTQDEIQTRIKAWREKGQVARHWREYENVYQKARRELVKEKSEKLPPDQIAALKIAWERDQKTILELAVDLHRYGKNREAEKQLLREMSGTNALQHLLNELPKSKSYQRNEVIQGLAELGGTNVIPVLKELMKDETLGTFGRSDGSGGSSPEERDKRTTWYVHYPIRDEAGKALASMGVRVQEKSNVLCNSPEGRAMVRKGLESADHVVRRSALQCVSSKLFDDKTLIPVLEKMLDTDSSNRWYVVHALGKLGDPATAPALIAAVNKHGMEPSILISALEECGGKEAVAYLNNLATATNQTMFVREQAFSALAELHDPSSLPVARQALKDTDRRVQLAAALALDAWDNEEGGSVIIKALNDQDKIMRDLAILSLQQSKSAQAKKLLNLRAQTPDGESQRQAAFSLIGKGGSEGLAAFTNAMADTDPEVRMQAIFNIHEANLPEAETWLVKALEDKDKEVRDAALYTLEQKGTGKSLDALKKWARSPESKSDSDFMVENAIGSILEREAKNRVGAFLANLSSTDPKTKAEAEAKQAALTDEDIQALVIVMSDYGQPETIRNNAEKVLKETGPRAIGPIIQSFADTSLAGRLFSGPQRKDFEILEGMKDQAVPEILILIKDPKRQGRESGIMFLIRLYRAGYPMDKIGGLEALIKQCCSDPDKEVRAAAVWFFLELTRNREEALAVMTTALGDPEHEVRYQVLMALERCDQPYFKDKDFLAALVPALIKALEFEDSSNILSSQFIAALGKTGDQRAIPVLQTILKTPEPENVDRFSVRPDKYTPRQEAARMLFTMGDKSLVPFWNNFTSDTDDVVVIWASAALCKSGDQVDEHLQKIGALLNESGVSGRIAAVEALKALNDKKAVPILVRYLRNQENIKCKPDVPAPRVTYSTDQNKEREDALTLLSDLGGKSVLEDLKWIMKEEKDGYVRRAAADAVTKWAGPDAETILIDCLPDPSPGVRFRICEILGVIGTSNAVTALQKVAINDPYKSEKGECDIREAARQSLKKLDIMSQKDRVDRVIAEANDEKSKLRQWAIEQLGNMKDDPKAEAALTALLKMPETKCSCGHYHYREAVAEILKKQGKNVVQKADGQYELAK